MKTPKRHSDTPDLIDKRDCARWKRKNRIAQLKRSLEKYKDGAHLYGSVGAAYRRLQGLVKPGKKGTIKQWLHYMRELQRIQEHITCAISNAGINVAAVAERKEKARKEKNNG